MTGACHSDITVEALARQPANTSCAEGYDQAICSVCSAGYKKTKDNSCLRTCCCRRCCHVLLSYSFQADDGVCVHAACDKATAQERAAIRWQNFVIPVLLALALGAAVVAVRLYLRDLTEIALLEKAEADRRLKAPAEAKRRQSVLEVAREQYRRGSAVVVSRFEQLKNRFERKPTAATNAKMLFGIEVEPPAQPFPIKPGKLKIFIGFFQIFGNFRDSFVIKWSADIQSIMKVSQQFNLVRAHA